MCMFCNFDIYTASLCLIQYKFIFSEDHILHNSSYLAKFCFVSWKQVPSNRDVEKCSFSLMRKLVRFFSSPKVTQRFPFLIRNFTYHSKSFHQDIKTSFSINSSFSDENSSLFYFPKHLGVHSIYIGGWQRVLTYFSIKRIMILIFSSNTQWRQLNEGILQVLNRSNWKGVLASKISIHYTYFRPEQRRPSPL